MQAGDEVPPGAHSADAPAGLGSPPSGAASAAQDVPNEAPGQAPPGEESAAPSARQPSTVCVSNSLCMHLRACTQQDRACRFLEPW